MNKEDIEKQLNLLRQKWVGHVPKNNSDPNYWKFRCDNCIAIGLKNKLEKWGNELKSAAATFTPPQSDADRLFEVTKAIFG